MYSVVHRTCSSTRVSLAFNVQKRCISLVIAYTLLAASVPVDANAQSEVEAVPGQYIVKFNSRVAKQSRSTMRAALGVQVVAETALTDTQLVQTTSSGFDVAYAKKLLASGLVTYIEPNYIVSINRTASDSRYSELWGMHNTGQTGGTNNIDIDAPEAWDITTGSNEIVVGVVDTGINYAHPDLAANMWVNPGEVAGNGIDDDGNGVVDDIHGFNAINGSGNPMDDHSHGSHCAGTIGGVANNGIGVAGVAWNVKLMGLKFLSASGAGTTQDAIEAIQYAINMRQRGVNLRVLSNSWGGGGYSQALADAVTLANSAGILFVAAAGNASNDNDVVGSYPSSYDIENVVSVAAIDAAGNLASFSNYGANSVDLAAPGVRILSTVLGSNYASYSGTSMATPHVSGVAALLLATAPGLTPAAMRARLMNTVKPLPSLSGLVRSPGTVNAYNALTNTIAPLPPVPAGPRYSKAATTFAPDTDFGTRVLNVDDGYYVADLPFAFPFYWTNFSRIAISANGRVIPLAAGESAPTDPDYSNRIGSGMYPFHDDLFPSPFSPSLAGVWFKSNGSSATITWVSVAYGHRSNANADAEIRFQTKLFPNGRVEFHYLDTATGDSYYDNGASASVGLGAPAGVSGQRLTISHNVANGADLGSGRALLLSTDLVRSSGDFDGDGKSDLVTWTKKGVWTVLTSSSGFNAAAALTFKFGSKKDTPFVGDFDGDGRSDIAFFRPKDSRWSLRLSQTNWTKTKNYAFGKKGDVPIVGDFDGDKRTDLATYRAKNATFTILFASTSLNKKALSKKKKAKKHLRTFRVSVGTRGSQVFAADFSGDGRDDFITVAPNDALWTAKTNEGQVVLSQHWGAPTDTFLGCDWDGDNVSDQVAVRADGAGQLAWLVRTTSGTQYSDAFGVAGDSPRCDRDYDGDSKVDLAVYRPSAGVWNFRKSSTGEVVAVGGAGTDSLDP